MAIDVGFIGLSYSPISWESFNAKNASYETAQIGTVRLVPSQAAIKDLSIDYDHMKDMIYGDKPSFDEIMESIAALETEINGLA